MSELVRGEGRVLVSLHARFGVDRWWPGERRTAPTGERASNDPAPGEAPGEASGAPWAPFFLRVSLMCISNQSSSLGPSLTSLTEWVMFETELERCLDPTRLDRDLEGRRSELRPRGVPALGLGDGPSRGPYALHDRRFSRDECDVSSRSLER